MIWECLKEFYFIFLVLGFPSFRSQGWGAFVSAALVAPADSSVPYVVCGRVGREKDGESWVSSLGSSSWEAYGIRSWDRGWRFEH